jgi:3-mercaptopyruvate sulfurtransferase SseA
MMRSALLLAILLAFASWSAQGQAQTAAPAAPRPSPTPLVGPDGARRISVDDARNAIENGQAIVIDVRTEDVYNAGHIKGALSAPLAEFDKHLSEMPKDKLIITYCS